MHTDNVLTRKPEMRTGAQELSASPTWSAAFALNATHGTYKTTRILFLHLFDNCSLYKKMSN